jgi:hypothetical protein
MLLPTVLFDINDFAAGGFYGTTAIPATKLSHH